MRIVPRTVIRMRSIQGIFVGLILAIVGVVFAIFAINSIATYNEKSSTFVNTVAEVVEHKTNSDDLKAVVVEYEVDGQIYTEASKSYTSNPQSIGTEIEIKYNPINPSDVFWAQDSKTLNIIFSMFAVVFILIGIAVTVDAVKKVRNGMAYM